MLKPARLKNAAERCDRFNVTFAANAPAVIADTIPPRIDAV
jgi:hypothetical protein